jgi:hypothetical protein
MDLLQLEVTLSNKLKALLGLCVAGLILGAGLFFSAAAEDNSGETPAPISSTSTTQQPNGNTVTNTTTTEAKKEPDLIAQYGAPGGIITVALTGILLIVREVNAGRNINVNLYKERAIAAESKAALDTQKLTDQVNRLEKKLDDALRATEEKHDLYIAEVNHRRKLELALAEHGIVVQAEV